MSKKEWQEQVLKPTVQRFPERQEKFATTSGIELDTLYTPEDVDINYDELGFPGEYPFTRGVHPTMHRGRLWTMRQYAGCATPEETNRRYHYLLKQGQTGLSVAFDLPTQIGHDSDHPLALGEVGKVGVPISTLKDMETLFEGIPLDKVSTSMTINSTAPILLAMYAVLGKKQGVDPAKLEGTVQNDVLKEYVARGTHIFPPRPSMRLTTDIFAYCSQHMPRWNTISVSGYHMREAGCTAVQEVAFTLANGIAYVQAAINAGLNVDAFAGRISFFFNCHNHFLEEIAKFRVARRLWAKIMKERFQAKEARSWMLRYHVQTAGCTLTAQQPMNNVVRVTLQALAAVLGGAQSLHTCSMDEAYAIPSEEAVTLSLRTQQVIAYESGVTDSVDPLGGSYLIEHLTDAIERGARGYIERIDSLGGAVAAIEQGFIQREIQEAAYRYQQEIESASRVVVGSNRFTSPYLPIKDILRVDASAEAKQRRAVQEVKKNRDNQRVQEALAHLEKVARAAENTMPALINCVEAYASVGEICDVLRSVFGTQREFLVF